MKVAMAYSRWPILQLLLCRTARRFQVCSLASQLSAKMKSQAVSQNTAKAYASEISNMGCLANVFPMAGSGNYRDFSPMASPLARPPFSPTDWRKQATNDSARSGGPLSAMERNKWLSTVEGVKD
ncbi:hypothetical protein BDP55DRAFT_265642 [Colletotrichum godetiae]|uniref:Uncharacterized protein n=1 Tax=Colletotrichum godetiae TaxID=1209918 RepID=A0AAJ0F3G3_9PEZI|nr:uncharacterized protein BDP55DRAFT_265642 [Colletotrichum godetiae]KAK1691467.1 hypothetical protein BDP55DRAFT_265642 [Colletotrichum godetiae]